MFRSKVDFWLVALVAGIPALVIEFLLEGPGVDDRSADLIALALVVIVLVFFVGLYLSTRYIVTSESLLVKSGPFSWIVPLREITMIEPTHNPASSPALSLDRLLVRYGDGDEVMVSPADKAGFMAAIKKQLKT